MEEGNAMIILIEQQMKGLKQKGLLHFRSGRQIALPALKSSAKDDATPVGQHSKSILSTHQSQSSEVKVAPTESEPKRITIQSSKRSSAEDNKSSFRDKLESRKKARTSRSKPKKKEISISAILSQTMNDDGESDEEYDTKKHSAMSCNGNNSTTPETNNDQWPEEHVLKSSAPDSDQARKHFKENISPIDQEGEVSIKDLDLSYMKNWDPTNRDTKGTVSKKKVTIVDDALRQEKKTVSKITRNDLGYMMDWDPFPKQREDDSVDGGASKPKRRGENNMSRIEEEAAGGENGITANSGSTCSQHSQYATRQEKRTSIDTQVSSKSQSASRDSNERSTCIPDISQLEESFLPLIEKGNIIRVANEPYLKLGCIGKGGSCKVYRALSKECNVVALKQVSLEGQSQQVIDGYANEINLLKKLRDNSNIIQLYSSEVDLERKYIYLVMELGEVDLNYVLRQQATKSSEEGGERGRSNLNMNFIRLTWQQMLKAVQSIHEKRIVHSDLKPAVRVTV
jgi:hypothetical protein